MIYFLLSLLSLLTLSACSTTQVPDNAKLIAGMSYFEQEDFQCGPSSLATVIDYWYKKERTNKSITPEDIASSIYSATARGLLGIDLELYAKRLGLKTSQYSGSINEIKKDVDDGIPIIVLVDYGISIYQVNHFMVITGYAEKGVIVNSGRERNKFISDEEFMRIWGKTGFWALKIKPSE